MTVPPSIISMPSTSSTNTSCLTWANYPNSDNLIWNVQSKKYNYFSNNHYSILNEVPHLYTLYDYNFVKKQLKVKNYIKK